MFKEMLLESDKVSKVLTKVIKALSNPADEVIIKITDSGDKFEIPLYEGDNAFDIPKVIKNMIKNKEFPWASTDSGYGKMVPIGSDSFPFSDVDTIQVEIYFNDGTKTIIK